MLLISLLRSLALIALVSLLALTTITQAQTPAPTVTIDKTLEGHKELVYSVSFSPDGKHLLSGSFDKALKLWDVATGKEVKTYAGTSGHNDLILTTAYSPDGLSFASGAKDNSIKLWDMPVSGGFREYPGSTAGVSAQAITPDGSKLATGQQDGIIRIWNTSDGKELAQLKGSSTAILALAISANAQWLAAGDASGKVTLYQLSDYKQLAQTAAHTRDVRGVGFHPNNQLLFSAGHDGLVKGWNLPPSNSTVSYKLDKAKATVSYRAPDGRIALACADKTIRILKNDGTLEKALPSAGAEIKCLSLVGNTVIASLADGKVTWWDIPAGTLTHQIDLKKAAISISLRSDGNEFAVALPDGEIKFGETSKDKSKTVEKIVTKTLANQGKVIVQYHPTDINVVAIADEKKNLKTWLIKEGKEEKSIALDAPSTHLTWFKDGSRLAAAVGNQLIIVQPKEAKIVNKLPHTSPVISGGFGLDSTRLITVTTDGLTHLFDVGNGKELQNFPGAALVAGIHSGGKKIIVATNDQVKVEPIAIARLIVAGAAPLTGLAIMDGGNRAVTASQDGVARVFNLTNGNLDKELKGHAGAIDAVTTTSNSQLVFTAGTDKTLRCFTPNDGKEIKSLPNPALAKSMTTQGNLLVVGHSDGSTQVLNIPFTPGQPVGEGFGKSAHTFKQPGPVTSVVMPGTSATIYTASSDKSIKSWKIASDVPLRNLAGHGNLVDAVVYSPDGHTLASCSHDGTIRLWNPHDGKQLGEVKLNAQPLYCLAWRSDGKQLALGSFDRSIRLIDVAGKKVEREIKGFDDKSSPNGHSDAVYSVAYAANDQVYSAGADGKIKLWNSNDGGMLKTFIDPALKDKAQRDFINNIKLTKDGKKLVAVGNGGWLTVWNTADGKMLHSQKMPVGLYGLSINNDGTLIATGNMNGSVYLIKMP